MGRGNAPIRLRDGQALGVSLPNWIGDPLAPSCRRSPSQRRLGHLAHRQRQHLLLDDLVRPRQHRLRDRQAERLRGFEIDYELEPR
jgi:hypothetical protein